MQELWECPSSGVSLVTRPNRVKFCERCAQITASFAFDDLHSRPRAGIVARIGDARRFEQHIELSPSDER